MKSAPLPDRGYGRHYQYLRQLSLPLPLPEQQHEIVAEIEKQFSRLDEAVANLKRVKANLKRYKAAASARPPWKVASFRQKPRSRTAKVAATKLALSFWSARSAIGGMKGVAVARSLNRPDRLSLTCLNYRSVGSGLRQRKCATE
jgi:hypothetical protein